MGRSGSLSDGIEDTQPASYSSFHQTVCLFDWWLIRTQNDFQGKSLGVAGLTSRQQEAVRVFSSAPIAKRFDVFTLETADGVCIIIKGFINKQRTTQNGFPSQVFNHFMFGFPSNWEQYAEKYFGKNSTTVAEIENCIPTTVPLSQQKTPKKYGCVVHEDRKQVEDLEDQSTSKVSNFSSHVAEDKEDQLNVTSIGFERCSDGLRNLESNQKNNASLCSLNENNVNPSAEMIIETQDHEKLNSSLGATILEVENSEDESREVPENIAIHTSKVSNFCSPAVAAEEREDQRNFTFKRRSDRLRNLEGNQKKPASICSLNENNVTSTAVMTIGTLDDDKLNSSLGVTVLSRRKVDILGKSTTHLVDRVVARNLSAKVQRQRKRQETVVRGLKSNKKMMKSPVPANTFKKVEDSKDEYGEVPENIAIHTSKVSNFSSHAAEEREDQMNDTSIGFRRRSDRLRNPEGNQKNPASRCSLNENDVIPTASTPTALMTIETLDDDNLNSSLGASATILLGRKVNILGKSTTHYVDGVVARNLSAKVQTQMKRKQTVVLLKNSVPANTVSNVVQNDKSKLGGSISCLSGKKLQEPMDANLTENDRSVNNSPQQTSNNKWGFDSGNVKSLKTKAGQETDGNEETTSGKKTNRKLIFDTQVTPKTLKERAKGSILSPESLSRGRSRSGRLLLPVLEFWRNQMPLYDAGRKITGIKDDLPSTIERK